MLCASAHNRRREGSALLPNHLDPLQQFMTSPISYTPSAPRPTPPPTHSAALPRRPHHATPKHIPSNCIQIIRRRPIHNHRKNKIPVRSRISLAHIPRLRPLIPKPSPRPILVIRIRRQHRHKRRALSYVVINNVPEPISRIQPPVHPNFQSRLAQLIRQSKRRLVILARMADEY